MTLNGRTHDESDIEFTFARLAMRIIRSGAILRDPQAQQLTGTARIRFLYGPPDGDFVRKYQLRVSNLSVALTPQGINILDEIAAETDEPVN